MNNYNRNSGRNYSPIKKRGSTPSESSDKNKPILKSEQDLPETGVTNSPNPPQSRTGFGAHYGQSRSPFKAQPSRQPPKHQQESDDRLENLVNTTSKHLNTSPEELKNAAQSGNMQKLFSQMSPTQAQQLQKILSDEDAAKKLLSTPQAQALLRRLSKNE